MVANIKEGASSILEEIRKALNRTDHNKIELVIDDIRKARNIFLVGAGRSRFILSTFCMRLNHLGFNAYMAGGLPCPPAGKGDLVISASGSGCTSSVLAVLERARAAGTKTDSFTANGNADIANLSSVTVDIPAPSTLEENGGGRKQLMRALFEQTAFLIMETMTMILSEGMDTDEIVMRHTNLE